MLPCANSPQHTEARPSVPFVSANRCDMAAVLEIRSHAILAARRLNQYFTLPLYPIDIPLMVRIVVATRTKVQRWPGSLCHA